MREGDLVIVKHAEKKQIDCWHVITPTRARHVGNLFIDDIMIFIADDGGSWGCLFLTKFGLTRIFKFDLDAVINA